jgi:hypothetical protein
MDVKPTLATKLKEAVMWAVLTVLTYMVMSWLYGQFPLYTQAIEGLPK